MADESLREREDSETARREADQLRAHAFSARNIESPSQAAPNADRSDRDTYSGGR